MQLAISSDAINPETQVTQNEHSEYIQGLLNELSEDDRAGIILKYWYDYSYAEIAEFLDTTESAIKSRLFRARRALAELLSDTDSSEDEAAQQEAINRLSSS
jgi:RNA polymerase sigma-70 factor (ECF subfamily)